MIKILILLKNWFKKFLLVRKFNIKFNGKTITKFSVAFAKDNIPIDIPSLKDLVAISFHFDNNEKLAVVIRDEYCERDFYTILILSVFSAWPNYKVHGFGVIDFVFRDTLSFLEKSRSRKILTLHYTVPPFAL